MRADRVERNEGLLASSFDLSHDTVSLLVSRYQWCSAHVPHAPLPAAAPPHYLAQAMSSEELREIFSFRDNCLSDTHHSLSCKRCRYLTTDGDRPAHELQHVSEAECLDDDDDDDDDEDDDGGGDDNDSDGDNDEAAVVEVQGNGDGGDGAPGRRPTAKPAKPTKEQKKKDMEKQKLKQKRMRQRRLAAEEAAAAAESAGDDGAGGAGGGGSGGGSTAKSQLDRSAQVGFPSEDQIALWAHHAQKTTIIDDVLRDCDRNNYVSFVFELRVPPMVVTEAAC